MRPGPALHRRSVPLAAAALLAPLLTGCGLVDGLLGGARVEEALEYLPAATTRLDFVDRSAIAERLEVADVAADASEEEFVDYVTAYDDAPAGTRLLPWVSVMRTEAAFSDLDVEWEVTAGFGTETALVWKLSDDLDLDAVADDLADAGYEAEPGGSPDTTVLAVPEDLRPDGNGMYGGRYPLFLRRVALVPDEHLLVSGRGLDPVVEVVLDDAGSLVDDGGFEQLLDAVDPSDGLELVHLARAEAACPEPRGRRATRATRLREELGSPEDLALVVAGEEPVTAVLRFGEEDAATADAGAREDYLARMAGRLPFEVDHEVTSDDAVVRVEAEPADPGAGTLAGLVRAEAGAPTRVLLACDGPED